MEIKREKIEANWTNCTNICYLLNQISRFFFLENRNRNFFSLRANMWTIHNFRLHQEHSYRDDMTISFCSLCQNCTQMSFLLGREMVSGKRQRKENIKLSSIEYVEKLNKFIKTKSKLKKKSKVELKKSEKANAHVNVLPLNYWWR